MQGTGKGDVKMERLTERVENCPDPKEIYGVWVKDHDYVAAAQRLADYEDTGLSPEEIVKMGMAYEDSKRYAARLEGRIKAYGEGRIVVLPCKVGDTLYEVTGRKTISEYRVKAIRVELFCVFIEWEIEKGFVWQSLAGITQNEIGKTVFLTREEAEKALEGMKDE